MPRYTAISGVEGILRINGYDFPAYWMHSEQISENVRLRTASSFPFTDERPANSRWSKITAQGKCKADFNPFLKTTIFLNTYVNITMIIKNNNTSADYPSVLVTKWIFDDDVNKTPFWAFEGYANGVFENFGRTNG